MVMAKSANYKTPANLAMPRVFS